MATVPGRPPEVDVIVVGSGAAGLAAACTAAAEGCRVVLFEQSPRIGGTTAISGGMVWVPANHKAAAAGRPDTLDAARRYLAQTVPAGGVAEAARLEAYLQQADAAVRDLEARTALRLRPVATYPDYYPDLPGATLGGRVLEPEPYDGRGLGAAFRLLRDPLPEFMLFGGMMISRQDIPHLRRAGRSPRSALHVARLLARHALQRLGAHRGTTLYLGNALVARLLRSALDLGVELRLGTGVQALLTEGGVVTGVEHTGGPAPGRLTARGGVILATGGLSHDAELRRRCVPAAAGELSATVDGGPAPRGARLALGAGAAAPASSGQGAFWVPASVFTRADGRRGVFPHTVTDRAKPGLIAVGPDGRRFVNEAVSYHEFVRAQLADEGRAARAWLICDRPFLWRYGLGRVRPFAASLREELGSGYLHRAGSIGALARAIGLDAATLERTVADYNDGARRGEDPRFGRGGDAYQRHLGDAERRPNPCVAPIDTAPYYAVQVQPADLGMSAGLATDAGARVLDRDGRLIGGLHACGNDMQSVMNGAYPGPGITLGPALTFGWLAGRDAAGRARSRR